MVRDRGFEPLTPSVSRKCSTTELTAQVEMTAKTYVQFNLEATFFTFHGRVAPLQTRFGFEADSPVNNRLDTAKLV